MKTKQIMIDKCNCPKAKVKSMEEERRTFHHRPLPVLKTYTISFSLKITKGMSTPSFKIAAL